MTNSLITIQEQNSVGYQKAKVSNESCFILDGNCRKHVSMLNSENQQENFLSTSFRRPCVVACATDETKLCETAPINPCSGPHLCTKI